MRSNPDDLPEWLQRHRWEVGARIRSLRQAASLSQIQLGERVHIDHKSISRYENGLRNLGIDEAAIIARGLGVPVWRLFRDE